MEMSSSKKQNLANGFLRVRGNLTTLLTSVLLVLETQQQHNDDDGDGRGQEGVDEPAGPVHPGRQAHHLHQLLGNKPEMVNAPEGLNKVILRKMKRFDCKTNQVSSKQLASF